MTTEEEIDMVVNEAKEEVIVVVEEALNAMEGEVTVRAETPLQKKSAII